MGVLIHAEDIELALKNHLERNGYIVKLKAPINGQTGVDMFASKERERLYIETISFKPSPPERSRQFYECFFRAISRLRFGATKCVMALPHRFGKGLKQRASNYGASWSRLGAAFPELEIWLVDPQTEGVSRTAWNDWLR